MTERRRWLLYVRPLLIFFIVVWDDDSLNVLWRGSKVRLAMRKVESALSQVEVRHWIPNAALCEASALNTIGFFRIRTSLDRLEDGCSQ